MTEQRGDLYAIIGVPADAARGDIVRAYRRQAQQVHPDTHPADPTAADRFRQLRAAYDVLVDPPRRRAYDQQRGLDQLPQSEESARRGTAPISVRAASAGLGAILAVGPVHVEPPSGQQAPRPMPLGHLIAALNTGPISYVERGWLL